MDLAVGDLIYSDFSVYEVEDILGSGSFGHVAQCRKLATNKTVAIKILKSHRAIEEAEHENAILGYLKEHDSDKFNIVRWNNSFTCEGRFCLEFEKLDISLNDFLQRSTSLQLVEIRPIMQQLATALEFLKSVGIVHADLKSENIMMVDHVHQPLRIKVIDFGIACDNPDECRGQTLQSLWHRSPEIMLGCRFNEAIDVWSLGCIAAKMLMGITLFPSSGEYDLMRHIIYTIGKPPDHLLNTGLYAREFFRARHVGLEPTRWTFKSSLEVRNFTSFPHTIASLDVLKEYKVSQNLSGEEASAEKCDRESFVDLLTKMLKVDPYERITPSQILQHSFITMDHLVGKFDNSSYVKKSIELMNICQGRVSDDPKDVAQPDTEETSDSTGPDEGHPAASSESEEPSLQSISSNSPAGKRKRDGDRSPVTSPPAKKMRDGGLDAAETATGGQTSPPKSPLQKRKRDEADPCTSDGDTPAKKRCVDINEELQDRVKKPLNDTEACSSSAQVSSLMKRKRNDEEAAGEETPSPVKRRRGCQDGER